MSGFDAELYLRLHGESMLIGDEPRDHGPWHSPLIEPARALVAVDALSAATAEAVIDDYAFAGALRNGQGPERRRFFPAPSSRRAGAATPLESRRVVPCEQTIDRSRTAARPPDHVQRAPDGDRGHLAPRRQALAVATRPQRDDVRRPSRGATSGHRRRRPGHGRRYELQRRRLQRGVGRSPHDRPTPGPGHGWIEIDGTRVPLTGRPAECQVSIEPLPDAPAAHAYLWRRLTTRQHFHEPGSLEPAIDALVAAGALDGEDPVIDGVRAVLAVLPHHPGMPSGGPSGATLPPPWPAMLSRQGASDGPDGVIALGAVTPMFVGLSVAINGLESRPEEFTLEVEVVPGLEGHGPFNLSLQPRQVAWWARRSRPPLPRSDRRLARERGAVAGGGGLLAGLVSEGDHAADHADGGAASGGGLGALAVGAAGSRFGNRAVTPWWVGLPPAQDTIDCGGQKHRLRWEAGQLQAVDHDDPEGERTLAALAGESCPCLDVLDARVRHRDDPRVLVLASRGPADRLAVLTDASAGSGLPRPPRGGRSGGVVQTFARSGAPPQVWGQASARSGGRPQASRQASAPSGGRPQTSGRATARPVAWSGPGGPSQAFARGVLRPVVRSQAVARAAQGPLEPPARPRPAAHPGTMPFAEPAESGLITLLGLGGALPDRLVATVAAAWRDRLAAGLSPELEGVLPQLQAALFGRAVVALRGWLAAASEEPDPRSGPPRG